MTDDQVAAGGTSTRLALAGLLMATLEDATVRPPDMTPTESSLAVVLWKSTLTIVGHMTTDREIDARLAASGATARPLPRRLTTEFPGSAMNGLPATAMMFHHLIVVSGTLVLMMGYGALEEGATDNQPVAGGASMANASSAAPAPKTRPWTGSTPSAEATRASLAEPNGLRTMAADHGGPPRPGSGRPNILGQRCLPHHSPG